MISSDLEKLLNQLPENMHGQVKEYVESLLSQSAQDKDGQDIANDKRILGSHLGAMQMQADFDLPLDDDFWLQNE